jgi:hypothetical protein
MSRPRIQPEKKVLTKAVLAAEWACGKGRIDELIKSGQLPAIDLAGPDAPRPQIRILREDAEQFLESRRVHPTSPPVRQQRRRHQRDVKEYV